MSEAAREFYANVADGSTRLSLRRAINAVGEAEIGILKVSDDDKALVPEDVMARVAEFVVWGHKTLIPAIEKAVSKKQSDSAKKKAAAAAKAAASVMTVSEAEALSAADLRTKFAKVDGVGAKTTKVKIIAAATAAGQIKADPTPKAAKPKAESKPAAPKAEKAEKAEKAA